MKKIDSFKINHLLLKQGIYVSRTDEVRDSVGNVTKITTYDIRAIEPATADKLTSIVCPIFSLGPVFHTVEHWGATYFRSQQCKFFEDVIYFGPMGCLTGFYLILKGNHSLTDVWSEVTNMFKYLLNIDKVPGCTAEECGRHLYHDLANAKKLARHYLSVLEKGLTLDRTIYPTGKVLFLCALEEEADIIRNLNSNFDKYVRVVGIGKVNAAVNAVKFIEEYDPNYIVSFGFAGGITDTLNVGDMIDVTYTFYHDVWCGEPNKAGQVQGFPEKFESSWKDSEITRFVHDAYRRKRTSEGKKVVFVSGTLATGDSFVTEKETINKIKRIDPYAVCVDMEGAAIAQVCYERKIPFAAYKIISDVVGSETQLEDYEKSVK